MVSDSSPTRVRRPDGAGAVSSAGLGNTDDGHQVDPQSARRRAPGADGTLVNASDHAARWYGVHCSPPLAPADQGDGGEDGVPGRGPERPGLDGRGSRAVHAAGSTLAFPTTRSRPAAWPCGGSERATGLDWGQPVSPPRRPRRALPKCPAATTRRASAPRSGDEQSCPSDLIERERSAGAPDPTAERLG